MIALAVPLVLIAALFHAVWNILLKSEIDPLLAARRAGIASLVIWTPVALCAWLIIGRPGIPPTTVVIAVGSASLEAAYFVFLSWAYRTGSLSAVYAIARGTAPVLSVAIGILVLGEHLDAVESVGVLSLLAGIWFVRRPQSAGGATIPAIATGVTIAAYSALDSVGVHRVAPWMYGYMVWCLTVFFLIALMPLHSLLRQPTNAVAGPTKHRGNEISPAQARRGVSSWLQSAILGLLMTSTFLIILLALRLAPLAIVSPLRESAIVLVTLWSVWRLGERDQLWSRLIGVGAVTAGAILLGVN